MLLIYYNNQTLSQMLIKETDNYGFLNANFSSGNYTAFFKPNWHSDDVKDYSLRLYFTN